MQLYNSGIKFGESIITITRDQSCYLHFKSGFFPQFNPKYFQYKKQKRLFMVRFIVNLRLKRLYKMYLNTFSANFLKEVNFL